MKCAFPEVPALAPTPRWAQPYLPIHRHQRTLKLNEPIAIVGMACRLPGADGLDAFWKLISEGGTAWGPLPETRLPRDLYFHPHKSRVGKSYSEIDRKSVV